MYIVDNLTSSKLSIVYLISVSEHTGLSLPEDGFLTRRCTFTASKVNKKYYPCCIKGVRALRGYFGSL